MHNFLSTVTLIALSILETAYSPFSALPICTLIEPGSSKILTALVNNVTSTDFYHQVQLDYSLLKHENNLHSHHQYPKLQKLEQLVLVKLTK